MHGSGRTDAGVHALGQVAHVDIERKTDAYTVREALNAHMREEQVVVTQAHAVSGEFHARVSAVERSYLYRILNRRPRPALDAGRVWHVPLPLDADAMHDAAQVLVGRHDFTSFRAAMCQAKSPERTLDELRVAGRVRGSDSRAGTVVSAPSDLNFAGTLELVGSGKWTAHDVAAHLRYATEQRPAHGIAGRLARCR